MPFTLANHDRDKTAALFSKHAWAMMIACGNPLCGHEGKLMPDDFARMPPETTTEEIASRLRCARCGSADGRTCSVAAHGRAEPRF